LNTWQGKSKELNMTVTTAPGKYRLVGVLGKGGFTTVCRARNPDAGWRSPVSADFLTGVVRIYSEGWSGEHLEPGSKRWLAETGRASAYQFAPVTTTSDQKSPQ
jgi:hypothetical protein